jgi:hypothetical protein
VSLLANVSARVRRVLAKNSNCEFVKIDDNAELCDKCSVEFYPTVLCFEKGVMTKRIDAKPGVGLNKKFEEFTR